MAQGEGPPVNTRAEWRDVALRKWRHYRDNVYPRTEEKYDVAQRFHAHSLAKMVPFLLGKPEEALLENGEPGDHPAHLRAEGVRERVNAIVREHLRQIGFYDNGDSWAEETTTDMVDALLRLPELGGDGSLPCDHPDHDRIECMKCERIECGAVYAEGTPPCSIDATWPHDEHSNGEWHWRTPKAEEPDDGSAASA